MAEIPTEALIDELKATIGDLTVENISIKLIARAQEQEIGGLNAQLTQLRLEIRDSELASTLTPEPEYEQLQFPGMDASLGG